MNVHRVASARYIEDGCLVKVLAKLVGVHGSTRNEEPQFRTETSNILLDEKSDIVRLRHM